MKVDHSSSNIQLVHPSTQFGLGIQEYVTVQGGIEQKHPEITNGAAAMNRAYLVPHRIVVQDAMAIRGVSQPFTAPVSYVGIQGGVGTVMPDGVTLGQSNSYALNLGPAPYAAAIFGGTQLSVAHQWIAVTVDVRWTAGVAPLLQYGDQGGHVLFNSAKPPRQDVWYTIAAVGWAGPAAQLALSMKSDQGRASGFELSAFQARTFDRREDAQAFIDSLVYVNSAPAAAPRAKDANAQKPTERCSVSQKRRCRSVVSGNSRAREP